MSVSQKGLRKTEIEEVCDWGVETEQKMGGQKLQNKTETTVYNAPVCII